MGLSIKELRKIVNFCKKNGIIQFKSEGFEFTISERALKIPVTKHKIAIPIAGMTKIEDGMPDMRLWSSTPPQMDMDG
jgi:hypothetical protein